jgi:uncharacterized protein (DUF1330 family)
MAQSTTLVVTALPNPAEMPSVQAYLQGVLPLLLGAGGTVVKRLKVSEVLNGRPAGMVLVMDFDSAEAAAGLFESDDYKALIPARDKGFAEMNIVLAQGM